MFLIGGIIAFLAFIVFIITIGELEVTSILMSVIFFGLGIGLIVYDVNSPVEITVKESFITKEFGNKTFSEPVKITVYKREATRFGAWAKDSYTFKYEIEILSEDAVRYWNESK